MNKRIRELAKCNERVLNFFQTGPAQRAAIEEFARLIVLECADISEKHWIKHKGCSAHFSIREHFGVELNERTN